MQRTSKPLPVRFDELDLCVLASHHTDNFRMEWTSHPFEKIVVVLQGKGILVTPPERQHAFGADSILYVPDRCMHSIRDRPDSPLSLYVVCYKKKVFPDEPSAGPVIARDAVLAENLRRGVRRLLAGVPTDRAQKLARLSLATQMLADVLGRANANNAQDGSPRQRVREYLRELRNTFFETESLDSVAKRLHMSRRRFTQLVREELGHSWLTEIRNLRLDQAKRLLLDPRRSVAAACFESGFNDLTTFYRAFRAQEGCAPEYWRKRRL